MSAPVPRSRTLSAAPVSSVSPAAPAAPVIDPAPARGPAAPGARPTVYFDGGCPLCRREVAVYQRSRGAEALRWCDLGDCPDTDLGPGLDRASALRRLHVRQADGRLLQGARAFVLIWASLPAFRPLARLAGVPGVLPLLDAAYALVLRLRPLWRPPACPLPPAAGSAEPVTGPPSSGLPPRPAATVPEETGR